MPGSASVGSKDLLTLPRVFLSSVLALRLPSLCQLLKVHIGRRFSEHKAEGIESAFTLGFRKSAHGACRVLKTLPNVKKRLAAFFRTSRRLSK